MAFVIKLTKLLEFSFHRYLFSLEGSFLYEKTFRRWVFFGNDIHMDRKVEEGYEKWMERWSKYFTFVTIWVSIEKEYFAGYLVAVQVVKVQMDVLYSKVRQTIQRTEESYVGSFDARSFQNLLQDSKSGYRKVFYWQYRYMVNIRGVRNSYKSQSKLPCTKSQLYHIPEILENPYMFEVTGNSRSKKCASNTKTITEFSSDKIFITSNKECGNKGGEQKLIYFLLLNSE